MDVSLEIKQMNDELVDRLIAYRKAMKLTQQDISDATGIKRPNVARIERKINIPTLESLQKYAKCVGMELRIELVESKK